jgi:putative endonuclease
MNRKQTGDQAERKALEFLLGKDLRFVMKNYRCRHGEIDIIMKDQDDIVFVEVRSRNRCDFGNAFETINITKRKKLMKTAIHFLQIKGWLYKVTSRFDVIAIHPINGEMQLEWIRNAFWFHGGF